MMFYGAICSKMQIKPHNGTLDTLNKSTSEELTRIYNQVTLSRNSLDLYRGLDMYSVEDHNSLYMYIKIRGLNQDNSKLKTNNRISLIAGLK